MSVEDFKRGYRDRYLDGMNMMRNLHRFEVYDINRLPPELQTFYYSLR